MNEYWQRYLWILKKNWRGSGFHLSRKGKNWSNHMCCMLCFKTRSWKKKRKETLTELQFCQWLVLSEILTGHILLLGALSKTSRSDVMDLHHGQGLWNTWGLLTNFSREVVELPTEEPQSISTISMEIHTYIYFLKYLQIQVTLHKLFSDDFSKGGCSTNLQLPFHGVCFVITIILIVVVF